MMFPWTKRTLAALSRSLVDPDERIELFIHLLVGSARWRLRRASAVPNPWEASGNTEYGVVTDRQLLILAADPGTGRPALPLLFATSRTGLTVLEVGSGAIRSIDLRDQEGTTFRLYVPLVGRPEGARLVDMLGSAPE